MPSKFEYMVESEEKPEWLTVDPDPRLSFMSITGFYVLVDLLDDRARFRVDGIWREVPKDGEVKSVMLFGQVVRLRYS